MFFCFNHFIFIKKYLQNLYYKEAKMTLWYQTKSFLIRKSAIIIKINLICSAICAGAIMLIYQISSAVDDKSKSNEKTLHLIANESYIFIAQTVFLGLTLYFGFHSVWKKTNFTQLLIWLKKSSFGQFLKSSIHELFLSFFMSLITTVISFSISVVCSHSYMGFNSCDVHDGLTITLCVILGINQVFMFVCFFFVKKEININLYKKMGATEELRNQYGMYEFYKTMMKALMATNSLLSFGIFIFCQIYWLVAFTAVLYLLYIIAFIRGYKGMRHEEKAWVRASIGISTFYTICLTGIVYGFYITVMLTDNEKDLHQSVITLIVAIQSANIPLFILFLYVGRVCVSNFGKGLREYLEDYKKEINNEVETPTGGLRQSLTEDTPQEETEKNEQIQQQYISICIRT